MVDGGAMIVEWGGDFGRDDRNLLLCGDDHVL